MSAEPVLTTSELAIWIGAFQVFFGVVALVFARRRGRQRVGVGTAPLGAMFMITGLVEA